MKHIHVLISMELFVYYEKMNSGCKENFVRRRKGGRSKTEDVHVALLLQKPCRDVIQHQH